MPRRQKLSYVCKYCYRPFHRLGCYRRHVRTHLNELPDSPIKPPNQLLSRKSDGEGVFDFDGVLDSEDNLNVGGELDSDVDSFYSDCDFHHDADSDADEHGDAIADDDSDANSDDNGNDDSDVNSDDDSDAEYSVISDGTYIQSESSVTNNNNDDDDCFSYDFEENEISSDEELLPNYTPRPFPDDRVPFSDNIYSKTSKHLSAVYIAQLQISQLFNRNKASIKMHDELIDIVNTYLETVHSHQPRKFLHRQQFMDKMEKNTILPI